MIYRQFGATGWDVSAIGLGTWNIGNQWGQIDEATAWATVRAAIDHGVNLVDTAESYGTPNGLSEERLGRALAGDRHRVFIVSKIGNWGKRTGRGVPKDTVDLIRLCAHASLHRLRTDWHDVLLCHEADIEDPSVYLEAFDLLKRQGKLRASGISTGRLDVLERFNAQGQCDVLEVDYSLLNRQPEQDLLPYCQEHGIAVLVRGPLARGLLSGKYDQKSTFTDDVRHQWNRDGKKREEFEQHLAQITRLTETIPTDELATRALRFTTSHPVQPVAIPGAKSPEQAIDNARAGERLLSEQELQQLQMTVTA